ncbi:transglutaminase domain-containing protein [Flavobacterium flavipallidum]|uniref:Transglutaminase domain-containing protein n=1 Tax=Flavobacterium flavipallidum TaxID=3139140 RepID=A0ABU9HHN2_9FLAO
MRATFLLFLCLCSFSVFPQKKQKIQNNYDSIDEVMDKMPADYNQSMDAIAKYISYNFQSEPDRIRAVYYWTTKTISYDVDNMFEVKFDEKLQDRIARAFADKKGVCFDYASIFNQLANSVGVKSFVISGYTKWNKVKVDNLTHAWNAARVDNKWYLFDPTWGSGFVLNGIFTRRLDDKNFKVDPELMINTHMPFDYLWQLKDFPITNQEFIEGVYSDDKKQKFDFVNEIEKFENEPKLQQLYVVAQRIEKGGMKNQHIAQAFVHAKTAWRNESERDKGKQYSEIVEQFNRANQSLNDFIHYRNKQFQPLVADAEIKRKIQEPRDGFVKCQEVLLDFEKSLSSEANKTSITNLREAISKRLENAEMHLQFVNNYLAKAVPARKMMFYNKIVMKPKQ